MPAGAEWIGEPVDSSLLGILLIVPLTVPLLWRRAAPVGALGAMLAAVVGLVGLAIVHTAVYEAANAITRRYPVSGQPLEAASGASVEAAIAAANYATLTQLVPSQQAAIDSAYHAALATIADGPAKTAGGHIRPLVSTCRRSSRRSHSGRSARRGC